MIFTPFWDIFLTVSGAALITLVLQRSRQAHRADQSALVSRSGRSLLVLLLTALLAYLFWITLVVWFSVTPQHNPLFQWLIRHLAGTPWFAILVFIQDSLQIVILSLPFAWLLLKTEPRMLLLKSAVIMMVMLFAGSWPIIQNGRLWLDWQVFLLPTLLPLPLLPLTLYLLARCKSSRSLS